jgi:predicted unusual protein kinase regulating ubiquinone biosynthesis (AarF/ABC1/UbiB family)
MRELARGKGRRAQLKAWLNEQLYAALDRFIRVLALRCVSRRRRIGEETGATREASAWLRESLIDLGPTFIKIGQALGTRADLLPLEYVKELATLQDQVPAFSTAEAFARLSNRSWVVVFTRVMWRSTVNRLRLRRWDRSIARDSHR